MNSRDDHCLNRVFLFWQRRKRRMSRRQRRSARTSTPTSSWVDRPSSTAFGGSSLLKKTLWLPSPCLNFLFALLFIPKLLASSFLWFFLLEFYLLPVGPGFFIHRSSNVTECCCSYLDILINFPYFPLITHDHFKYFCVSIALFDSLCIRSSYFIVLFLWPGFPWLFLISPIFSLISSSWNHLVSLTFAI